MSTTCTHSCSFFPLSLIYFATPNAHTAIVLIKWSDMHLIHMLRRSISHRPRHLFDLPDEILCQILEYCCQDLDFLLWSCPLVTLDNQFCHDCFHCTLCHGPIPRISSLKHRHLSTTAAFAETSKETHGQRTESASEHGIIRDTAQGYNATTATSDRAQHRKRRKRNLDTLFLSSIHGRQLSNTWSHYAGSSPSSTQRGSKPCPWNGDRPWCLHVQCQQQDRIPLLWRLVPPQLRPAGYGSSPFLPTRLNSSHPHRHLTTLSTSLASMQLPAKVAFNTLLQRIEAFFSWDRSQLNEPRRIQGDEAIRTGSAISTPSTRFSTLYHANPVISLPSARRHAAAPVALTSGFRLDQDASLHRRRTASMTTRAAQSTTPNTSMNRTLSTAGTINIPNIWRRGEWIDPADDMDESETTENGQHRDDFDSSIHLSPPFQLLLVSRRFADAAVHSLHRSLVFHGHDPYQVECVLSTLLKDNGQLDQDQCQDRSTSLRSLKELNEEQLVEEAKEEEADQSDNDPDQIPRAQDTSRSHGVDDKIGKAGHVRSSRDGSTTEGGLWQMGEGQGASVSWIESLNHSLRRLSRFQGGGVSGVGDASNAEVETSKVSFLGGKAGFAGEGGGGKRHTAISGQNRRVGVENQDGPLKMNSNEPKWTYRRYARRVVLNFAHPQASPQLLVRALECIGSRCHGQIQALDLHANEKMQDSGLATPEELIRLFGSGFTKLRYLRLQGGFIDNQLLYALLNNFASPTLTPPSDSAHVSYADGWRSFEEPRIHSPQLALSADPCCLSQVFLGPGSVTDSAVERLVDVAGKTLEVFTVTSCVDVGGGALASLLTKCPKLRVLAVHRSLARDRELLEGLGIPPESVIPGLQQHQQVNPPHLSQSQQQEEAANSKDSHDAPPQVIRKTIVAPLERLELGTVKLTNTGVTEILKATSKTLRFLVLETQHFNDEFLRNVVSPLCTRLEGLHFDDPEQVQRLQQQMQGLGFSAGRRGPHLPRNRVAFGRSGRSFYSDPTHHYRSQPLSHHSYSASFRPQHYNGQEDVFGSTTTERQGAARGDRTTKVSAWLGETTTDEWVTFGDCALWSSAASPAVSYDNGGDNGLPGGRLPHQHRQHGQPLHQMYHKPALAMGNAFIHGFNHRHRHQAASNWFLGDSDELLDRHRVARETVDEVQEALSKLETFTAMELDFVLERKGLYEAQLLMRQDDMWVQSTGFRALQMFYLCLFLSTIYFSVFR